jgi:hypothetical protein
VLASTLEAVRAAATQRMAQLRRALSSLHAQFDADRVTITAQLNAALSEARFLAMSNCRALCLMGGGGCEQVSRQKLFIGAEAERTGSTAALQLATERQMRRQADDARDTAARQLAAQQQARLVAVAAQEKAEKAATLVRTPMSLLIYDADSRDLDFFLHATGAHTARECRA